jgi:hypothetical protein
MCRHQNVGQNHNTIEVANIFFENVASFKYLEKSVTKQNYIHEETKPDKIPGRLAIMLLKTFSLPSHI